MSHLLRHKRCVHTHMLRAHPNVEATCDVRVPATAISASELWRREQLLRSEVAKKGQTSRKDMSEGLELMGGV